MEMNQNEFSSASRTSLEPVESSIQDKVAKQLQMGVQLYDAIRTGNFQRVKELLVLGAPVHAVNHAGDTPLHLAVVYGENTECLQELIKYGACVDAANQDGDTPLHLIIENEEKVAFATTLLKHGDSVNAINFEGDSPLHLCVGNLEGFKILLRYGADVRAVNSLGDSPLHTCVEINGNIECVQLLLNHGADVRALNHLRQTPLHMLSESTDAKLIEHLLLHGADIHINDSIEKNPLGIAMADAPLLAKLFVKYTLFHTFDGNPCNLFNLSAYNDAESYESVALYLEECVLELSKMREMKIRDRFSLHVIVTTKNSNIALFHRNRNVQDVTHRRRLFAKYPIYADFIYPKVTYALERSIQLDKLKEVFAGNEICHSLANTFGEKGILNYDCTSLVSKFLSNDELCNFVSALGNSNLDNNPETGFEKPKLRKQILETPPSSCTKKARVE